MTATFNGSVLRPSKITVHLAARTTSGTVGLSGFTQRVSSPASAWVITYDGIVVGTRAQYLLWNAYEAALEGSTGALLIPLIGEGSNAAIGTAVGSSAVGDTSIVIGRSVAVEAGAHFSIVERLYRVAVVTGPVGANYTAIIRPPLRVAVVNGTGIEFGIPLCKCRLATDDEMILERDSAGIGVGKLRWYEDPTN